LFPTAKLLAETDRPTAKIASDYDWQSAQGLLLVTEIIVVAVMRRRKPD
jgi:hypothetical protein